MLVDIGLVNQPIKMGLKIICLLQKKMNKLFESNKQVKMPPTVDPDAKIIHHSAALVQFEPLRL